MPDKLEPIRNLLRNETTLVLATKGEEAAPHATPLFFLADDNLNLYWFSSRSSRHSQHCGHGAEVSVAIAVNAHQWQQIRGVQMHGYVSVVADRGLRQSITARYIERFALGQVFTFTIRKCSLFCFTPSWVRYVDNARRFGYKVELNLPGGARRG